MNRKILLASTAIVVLMSSTAQAAEKPNIQVASAETNEQMCARWAGYQKLQGAEKDGYIKDCQLDLRVPDKDTGGGGD